MARKLPWESSGAAKAPTRNPAPTPAPGPAPRQRSERPTPLDSDGDAIPTPKKQIERKSSQEPSTSPPPAPPETTSLMRPGYHADDIYKMVEDELHATAQSFTRHLHYAEYNRLKKQGRNKPPPQHLPSLLSEKARTETQRKFQTMELHGRQDDALRETGARGGEGEPEMDVRDPWAGTHLARLMGKEAGRRERTALVGLQGVPSKTRAASGFSKGDEESPEKKRKGNMDGLLDGVSKKLLGSPASEEVEGEDNLEPGLAASSQKSNGAAPDAGPLQKFSTTNLPATWSEPSTTQSLKPQPRPSRRKAFDDDFDMDAISPLKPMKQLLSERGKGGSLDEKKKRKEKEMKARFREIPQFLV